MTGAVPKRDLRAVDAAVWGAAGAMSITEGTSNQPKINFLSPLEEEILAESQETMSMVHEILESGVLPFGWEEAVAHDGSRSLVCLFFRLCTTSIWPSVFL